METNDKKPDNGKKRGLPLPLALFLTFFKIGLFTFGGGYAMISVIESNCVEKRGWTTHDDMMNITVIAESTPGPIAINCATFVGFKQAGLLGAAAATLGVVLPSFIIIFLISLFLDSLLEIKAVASAFRGIRLAVGLLIVSAAVNMIRKAKKKPLYIAILSASAAVMLITELLAVRFSTIALMLIAAAAGLAAYLIGKRGKEAGK